MRDLERTEWSWGEFRKAAAKTGTPKPLRRPLFSICNEAVRRGLTRTQVAETVTAWGRGDGRNVLQAQDLIDALAAQIPEED